jgi:hypothetical protein
MKVKCRRHRLMMALVATGVITALAPAPPVLADDQPVMGNGGAAADEEARTTNVPNIMVPDLGIQSYRGDRVVDAAYAELNSDHTRETPPGSNCNYYSSFWGKGCQPWCADFIKFVWKNAGVYDWQQLNSEAGNTARWARQYGLWHWGTAGIFPGAAVTYNSSGDPFVDSDHVGAFVGWVNGQPKVVSGNYQNQVYKHNLNYGTPIAGWADPGS